MPTRHTVRQGDTLSALAARFGFGSPRDLHEHGDNAELKGKRAKHDQLVPGDVVIIPDREPKEAPCATGGEHVFRVKIPRIELKLRVVDHKHEALSGKPYRLEAGELRDEGTLPDDGMLDVELPADVTSATLRVWLHPKDEDGDEEGDLVYPLAIGHLDPDDELSGVQGRLVSLGYRVPTSGELDEPTRSALESFQRKHGLEITGEPDGPTRDKLTELHTG